MMMLLLDSPAGPQAQLSALLHQQCREWEENADPDGRQFQRAKRHDDKAIASIRLT